MLADRLAAGSGERDGAAAEARESTYECDRKRLASVGDDAIGLQDLAHVGLLRDVAGGTLAHRLRSRAERPLVFRAQTLMLRVGGAADMLLD
jgi:hypothetical protein